MVIGYRLLPHGLSHKETSLEARKLLKQLVAHEAGVSLADLSLQKNDNGAPQLSISGTKVYCSISHKNNCVVAAYSTESPIGVDVENLESNKDYSRIREHYADGFLKGVTTKEDFFYRWTLAEAYAKAELTPLLDVLSSHLTIQRSCYFHYRKKPFVICLYTPSIIKRSKSFIAF